MWCLIFFCDNCDYLCRMLWYMECSKEQHCDLVPIEWVKGHLKRGVLHILHQWSVTVLSLNSLHCTHDAQNQEYSFCIWVNIVSMTPKASVRNTSQPQMCILCVCLSIGKGLCQPQAKCIICVMTNAANIKSAWDDLWASRPWIFHFIWFIYLFLHEQA